MPARASSWSPSPEVIPAGVLSASIHRYQVKADYGLWNYLELGLTADLEGYDLGKDGVRNQILFGRLRLLDSERFGVGLSVGVDGIGLEDLGGKAVGFLPKEASKTFSAFMWWPAPCCPFTNPPC